jgi:hypothetical protein
VDPDERSDGMTDRFLRKTGVLNPDQAMRNSLSAALQHNRVYQATASLGDRKVFRLAWAALIKEAVQAYSKPVTDGDHCAAIGRISDQLSTRFGPLLLGSSLRFGTSQKALNLYLKFLWRLRGGGPPPHCPVDRKVLREVGLRGCWTKSDSRAEYMTWITAARTVAGNLSLADWEYALWNQEDA